MFSLSGVAAITIEAVWAHKHSVTSGVSAVTSGSSRVTGYRLPGSRMWLYAGLWMLAFGVVNTAGAITVVADLQRLGVAFRAWEPWVWEYTSAVGWLLLVGPIALLHRRMPLTRERWPRSLALHAAATLPASLLHVLVMVGLRHAVYALLGHDYDFGDWRTELLYEYRKDVFTYAAVVGVLHVHRRLASRAMSRPHQAREERLRVRTLGREHLVPVADIAWVEAAGNYVNLHTDGRVYPMRATMAATERRLSGHRFARVHRSRIVNLERVRELVPSGTGDGRILLDTGDSVGASRRYLKRVRAALQAD